ncbi:MAG: GAF domain-containing sensor histidine kinase [Chloroflexi bacterium]|nr:GAF domain-containing sensor histidine kinase [Chloroflexota bacterium]
MNSDHKQTLIQYQRILEISRRLTSEQSLDALLNTIVQAAAEISASEAASILLYDEPNQRLHFQAATNMGPETMRGISVPTESLAGWVAINRAPVIVPDVRQDKRWFGDLQQKKSGFATRSLIAVPMIARERLVGVLEVLNKMENTYDQDDLELLQVLSGQAALAIEQTRLYQQSDMIAELVHELRTPLTSIGTIAYLLQRPTVGEADRLSLAKTIQQETQRLSNLSSSFLDLARLEAGRVGLCLTEFNLSQMIEECVEIIRPSAAEQNIEVLFRAQTPETTVRADPNQIKQVLLNLLTNAVKYNRPRGKITIAQQKENNGVSISVSDTGIGIPPEQSVHIFEKFYRVSGEETARRAGTGLGLSICKRIIENHGGKISFTSVLNQGSTFTIYLPASA